MQPTVLVGFAEAMSAPEVVWSLVDHGYQIIAFSRKNRKCALRYSRYVTCHEITPPEVDVNAALSELDALCRETLRRTPVALFPLDDTAVWLASRLSDNSGCVLVGPSLKRTEIALDKAVQIEYARAAGFNVPMTSLCSKVDELRRVGQAFPFIVRPAKAVWESEGRLFKGGLWICENMQELEVAISKWDGRVPVLVQPYIQGVGEGLFGLAMQDGVHAWCAHRRLRMMNPHGSGSSACISQPVGEEQRLAAGRFIQNTAWRGLFMIELLRDSSGTAWFVEFNGRPWGSMALCRRQGLEYPAWNVALSLNDASSVVKAERVGTEPVICRHLGRELMHLLFVLRGPRSKAIKNWPSFWKTMWEMVRVRGRNHFYNWRKDDPWLFVADCLFTIQSNIIKSRKART